MKRVITIIKILLIFTIIYLFTRGIIKMGKIVTIKQTCLQSALVVTDVKPVGDEYITDLKYALGKQVYDKHATFDTKYDIGYYFEIWVNPLHPEEIHLAKDMESNGLTYIKVAIALIFAEIILFSATRKSKKKDEDLENPIE